MGSEPVKALGHQTRQTQGGGDDKSTGQAEVAIMCVAQSVLPGLDLDQARFQGAGDLFQDGNASFHARIMGATAVQFNLL